MSLIASHRLSQILVDQDPEAIDLLIKNFSPTEMAFEAEVLNYSGPIFVYFYEKQDPAPFKTLESIALLYKNRLKIVTINAGKLFKILENSEIDTFPTFMIIENRQEKGRQEESLNNEQELIDFIEQTLNIK